MAYDTNDDGIAAQNLEDRNISGVAKRNNQLTDKRAASCFATSL
jgi:hypothetical protein